MPATNGTYKMYELHIYTQLLKAGFNTAAACGILTNLYAESGFNPMNLQNSYEKVLGYDDTSYTRAVDNKSYKNFSTDSAGYGLAQWTFSSRKANLLQYANSKKTSIGDLDTQIEFLLIEMRKYTNLWKRLTTIENSAQGAYDAAYYVCLEFERPAGGSNTAASRGTLSRDTFWSYYSKNPKEVATIVTNKGATIVEIAKKQIDKSYIAGGYLYNNELKGADDPGLVYYCYKEAGIDIPLATTSSYYYTYRNKYKKVTLADISAGDLVFYDGDQNTGNGPEIIAIATGEGTVIYADKDAGKIEYSPVGTPMLIIRLLADSETGNYSNTEYPDAPGEWTGVTDDYTSLSFEDPNSAIVADNLSKLNADGYDLGYLIDVSHGGSFRFYIPEFSESAGAKWSPIDIRGRSVTVQSYESTDSRKIQISLDLYAGVGVYEATSGESGEDTVSRLHQDAYFLKSLEYPDYSVAITRPPATVHLLLGSAVNIEGVVSGVTVEHLKPFDEQNRAMYLKVSFTVTQIAVNPPDWSDIRSGQTTLAATADISSLIPEEPVTSPGLRIPPNRAIVDNTMRVLK